VHGASDLSTQDQADILGRVLDKSIRYQQIPLEALREALLKRGASPSVAEGYVDMYRSFVREDYQPTE
jgi:uncharacterized protein YbjT (DUF2867 family)